VGDPIIEEEEIARVPVRERVVGLGRDSFAALLFLLGRRVDAERAAVARGAFFFPLFGAALGSLASGVLGFFAGAPDGALAAFGVLLLLLVSGGRFARDFFVFAGGGLAGGSLLLGLLGLEWWALLGLEGNFRAIALVLTPMLGRWGYVVQGYGSLPARAGGFAAVFVKEMQFTQFATASTSAMVIALVFLNALGTLMLFSVASLTILLRIFIHSRRGGVSAVSLGAGALMADAITLGSAGLIARLAAG
jgi:cobalamin synthase